MDARLEKTEWENLAIVCPECGNRGEPNGPWTIHGKHPFRILEFVIRSWKFYAEKNSRDHLLIVGDSATDMVDWESGTGIQFECMSCFAHFPLPDGAEVDFE